MARDFQWFVEALNEHTNEMVSAEVSTEDVFPKYLCPDGIKRNLFRVPAHFVSFLNKSNLTNSFLDFNIWIKEGKGKLRKWNLQDRVVRRRQRVAKVVTAHAKKSNFDSVNINRSPS